MKFGDYPKAGSLEGVGGFRDYVRSLGNLRWARHSNSTA
jgi:hypothetical protein